MFTKVRERSASEVLIQVGANPHGSKARVSLDCPGLGFQQARGPNITHTDFGTKGVCLVLHVFLQVLIEFLLLPVKE